MNIGHDTILIWICVPIRFCLIWFDALNPTGIDEECVEIDLGFYTTLGRNVTLGILSEHW